MNINLIPPFSKNKLNAVIETPRGSALKLNYDAELNMFRLKKFLPIGMVFPFDFGFIPNTLGEDGDPLDVIVFAEEQLYPGCLVSCRLLGVMMVRQTDPGKPPVRNDRFVVIPDASVKYNNAKQVTDLGKDIMARLENFFIDYNKPQGKLFECLGWAEATEARQMIIDATIS